jgi:hypothetical protein
MTDMGLVTGANGIVRGFPYHDGLLAGIHAIGSEVALQITAEDDRSLRLVLSGVRLLLCQNFFEGNVIGDIFMWNMSSAPESELKEFMELRQFDLSRTSVADFRLEHQKDMYLSLDSSIGAEVRAVFASVRVEWDS